ncbi:MAG: hypothetical protein PF693_09880 [Spirochaetia bacterium]|jgi:hypothetical protein|nr:hypothetical protein [Spirochaetia bacterium]
MGIYLCGARIYKYGKWTFEYGMGCGLWPIRKDGKPYKIAGKKFYADLDLWLKMDDTEKENYRVGGGCERYETT